ncbi:MAG: PAS domain S-box protein [Bacteroidales bacterium]
MHIVFLIVSSIFLIFTAFWSIKLIKDAKGRSAWIAFSAAFCLLAIIRIFELIHYLISDASIKLLFINDLFDLLLSLLVAVGVVFIGQVFFSMDREEKIRIESENRFKTLFNNSSDQIYVIDLYGNFVEVNQVIIDLLGYSKEDFMNMHIREIKSSKYFDTIDSLLEKIKLEGNLIFEAGHLTKNGKIIPVKINSRLISYSNGKAILSMARDITERKQTERKIVNAIIETEEKEKERFAKDLHDGLGTLLSSINIYISLIKSGQVDDAQKENLFNYTKGLIDEAILNAKEIANNLRPNVISRFGLVAAVKSLCEKINNTGVLKIEFTTGSVKKDDLNSDLEVTLYRIINELINNTLKHASANIVNINMVKEANILILKYQDNGKGFDVDKAMSSKTNKGMGLTNIISRVNAINGTFRIKSTSEFGTEVIINVKI